MTTKITEFLAKQADAEAGVTPGPWWVGDPQPFVPGVQVLLRAKGGTPIRVSESCGQQHAGVSSDGRFIAHTRTSAPMMRRALEAVMAEIQATDLETHESLQADLAERITRAIESALTE